MLRRWALRQPDVVPSNVVDQGDAARSRRHFTEASSARDVATGRDPGIIDSLPPLRETLTRAGALEDAKIRARRLVEFKPGTASGYLLLASILKLRRRFVSALTARVRAAELDPANRSAVSKLMTFRAEARQAAGHARQGGDIDPMILRGGMFSETKNVNKRPRARLEDAFGIAPDEPLTLEVAQRPFSTLAGGDAIVEVFRILKAEAPQLNRSLDVPGAMRITAASLLDPRLARRYVPSLADLDDAFKAHVAAGDAARDQRNWGDAEYQYWCGLNLYPNHVGYRVQYAHMLKEAGKYPEASINYLTAFALGETSTEILRLIDFTLARTGGAHSTRARSSVLEYWLNLSRPFSSLEMPATKDAVDALVRLFLHRTPTFTEIAEHMCACGSVGDLCCRLVGMNDFATVNRDLITLVARKDRSVFS